MVAKDCLDILKDGNTISGVYEVYLDKAQKFVKIFCDLDTDNGGWLVRMCADNSFYRALSPLSCVDDCQFINKDGYVIVAH